MRRPRRLRVENGPRHGICPAMSDPHTPTGTATQDACHPPDPTRADLVARYLHLTRTILPGLARTAPRAWPVRHDHCFQRIVLDAVCGGVWYDHIDRPAYRHLTHAQAARAVRLCERIMSGQADLAALNRRSLGWRGKLRPR